MDRREATLLLKIELTIIEKTIKKEVREGKNAAWKAFLKPQIEEQKEASNTHQ